MFQTSTRRGSVGLNAKLAEHRFDVVRLRGEIPVGHVADMEDDVGLDHLLQRGAESRHQRGRQIGDEADGIREADPVAGGSATARKVGSSVANSMSADSTLAAVMRLNSVDLPALV